MTSAADKDFDVSPALLGAFVRAVATAGDSPTVIRRVAENATYVTLCRRVAALEEHGASPVLLVEACRKADITLPRLRARLAPVAAALGLVSEEEHAAYYRVLGVPPDSDAEAIRNAYRRRARELHPDLQPDRGAEPVAFAALTEAYQTLRDPGTRQAYDARRRAEGSWFEPDPQHAPPKPPRRNRFTAVIVVVLVLVAVALVLDQLERESAQRVAFRTSRSVAARPVPPPPVPPAPARAAAPDPAPQPVLPDIVNPFEISRAQPPVATVGLAALPGFGTGAPEAQDTPSPEQSLPPAAPDLEVPTAPPPASPHLSLFYDADRDGPLADDLRRFLTAKGFSAVRTAHSAEARLRLSNIRYFNAADRKAARDLQSAVKRFMVDALERPAPSVRLINLSRRYPDAKAGLLEVWLNTGAPAQDAPEPDARPMASTTAQPADPATSAAPEAMEDRIRRFLDAYCRTYESLAPERLAALFAPTATENGRPFEELLPRYRTNMSKMASVAYRIDLETWEPIQGGAEYEVRGRFTARGERTDRRKFRSTGRIRLMLAPHADAFKVARLAYEID